VHELSINEARGLALAAQFPSLPGKTPRERALAAIEHLGYVQIDTIHVVQRAHHHTLWARDHAYTPDVLDTLLAQDRAVFEYWGHAASYLPMADYRYYLPLMKDFLSRNAWFQQMYDLSAAARPRVLERIRTEGPLGARDFENPNPRGGTWWDWKPAKIALEMLMWLGELMVTRRDGFQRIYDLTERVLPTGVNTTLPTDEEVARFAIKRALQAHGLAQEKTIVENMNLMSRDLQRTTLKDMAAAGEVHKARVEDVKGVFYLLPAQAEAPEPTEATRILSPFDSACIHRHHVRELFDFDYTIECYTPAPKRKYGYFTLPVVHGRRFVGRLDTKAERKGGVLQVLSAHFEPGVTPGDGLPEGLAAELTAFARFNGCKATDVGGFTREWKQKVQKAMKDVERA